MPISKPAAYVIKAEIHDLDAPAYTFAAQKTMYGGKSIAAGDVIFLFASENEGGRGLFARGIVTAATNTPKRPGLERQTPRVSISVGQLERAEKPLGRAELKPYRDWNDGQPQTELNFMLYRQATNKIVGVTAETAAFLHGHFNRQQIMDRLRS